MGRIGPWCVYLDVSSLNRPGDDQQQARFRLETEAVAMIIERCDDGRWLQVASEIALIEIRATRDGKRRRRALALLPDGSQIAPVDDAIWSRAMECQAMGFKPADAVHVAAAEALRADVLLTCDDRMIKTGTRNRARLHVTVANPLSWLEEHNNDPDAR